MRSCGVRRPSVCLSVNFLRKSLLLPDRWLIATKLTHDGPQTGLHPGCTQAQGRGQRSRDTCTFVVTKIASSRGQMAGSPQNLHTMVPRRACIQDVFKVKVEVKLHVIRALIGFHKNRFFSQANGWILTKLSLSLTSPSLCSLGFLPLPNPQMAVSLLCEFRHSSHGETVCQTVCYTVRFHVLSLRVLTLWSTITLSFQAKYQAARCDV